MLTKLSFKLRKFNLDVEFFNLHLNNNYKGWGFDIFKITKNLNSYSFFKIIVLLPNCAETNNLRWTVDVFFLKNLILRKLTKLEDKNLWNPYDMTLFDKLKLRVLQKWFN